MIYCLCPFLYLIFDCTNPCCDCFFTVGDCVPSATADSIKMQKVHYRAIHAHWIPTMKNKTTTTELLHLGKFLTQSNNVL